MNTILTVFKKSAFIFIKICIAFDLYQIDYMICY